MKDLLVDLHVHLGSSGGAPVKIGASPALTLEAIIQDAPRSGMDVVGVVDCQVRGPRAELARMLDEGRLLERPRGGFSDGSTLIIPGAEIQCGGVHFLCYLPDREGLDWVADLYEQHVANPTVSTGTVSMDPAALKREVESASGVFVPAHVFTPYRGLYGRGLDLETLFGGQLPALVELGLSADTRIAGSVAELQEIGFLSNSDAHSFPMIGREHNVMTCRAVDFASVFEAATGHEGFVSEHFGLDPRLGKYHRTVCARCGWRATREAPPVLSCMNCGGRRVVTGVLDTAAALPRVERHSPRAPYRYQVPLQWLPGVGPKTRARLVDRFKSPWSVIHHADLGDIDSVAGTRIARQICLLRSGKVSALPGGGGRYGKLMFDPPTA